MGWGGREKTDRQTLGERRTFYKNVLFANERNERIDSRPRLQPLMIQYCSAFSPPKPIPLSPPRGRNDARVAKRAVRPFRSPQKITRYRASPTDQIVRSRGTALLTQVRPIHWFPYDPVGVVNAVT